MPRQIGKIHITKEHKMVEGTGDLYACYCGWTGEDVLKHWDSVFDEFFK